MHPLCHALAVASLIFIRPWADAPDVWAARAASDELEMVILLHGMARGKGAMKPLENFLAKNGFSVINTGYPSTREPVETLAEVHLGAMVEHCRRKGAHKIHLVTHSLGGIVARQYLQHHDLPLGSRIVMIAPPNQGSELADKLRSLFLYRWLNGPAGQVLGTEPDSLPNRLKPISGEIGVIAGNFSWNPLFSWMIPGEDDGKVSVRRAKLSEMTDFCVVGSGHSFIMRHPQVLGQVAAFLKTGRFENTP